MCSHYSFMDVPESRLTRFDGRVKMFLSLLALAAVVSSRHWQYPFAAGVLSLLILGLAGVRLSQVWRRLRPVLLVSGIVGVTQIFFFGSSVLFQWKVGPLLLTGYREGLTQGALLSSRVLGGMSVMFLLTLSTTVQEWVSALAFFRVPLSIVEIMTLAYSSLFVLLEEIDRLQKAQRMRLGYSSWYQSIKAVGAVGGILFTRVFDKSLRLWQAMLCRGYNGEIRVTYARKLQTGDFVLVSTGFCFIALSWVALH